MCSASSNVAWSLSIMNMESFFFCIFILFHESIKITLQSLLNPKIIIVTKSKYTEKKYFSILAEKNAAFNFSPFPNMTTEFEVCVFIVYWGQGQIVILKGKILTTLLQGDIKGSLNTWKMIARDPVFSD